MTILMVPGPGGPGHWQRRWLSEIDDAVLVAPDEGAGAGRAAWSARLAAAIRSHPGAILVGHGLGVLLIAHLAAERPDLPVGAALLAAPPDVDAPGSSPVPAGFAPVPIRPFAFPSVLAVSRNDPGMRFDKARVLANLWESALVDLGRAGPLASGEGLGGWPRGRDLLSGLERLVASAGRAPAPVQGGLTAA